MNIPSTLRTCLFVLLLHANSDVTIAKYQTLNGQCIIIGKLCKHTVACKYIVIIYLLGLSKLVHCISNCFMSDIMCVL